MAVQSMRSATYVHPGERLVCQGCHERKHTPPSRVDRVPLAVRRAPSKILPDVEGSNPFGYARLVQPVLDRNCVECHREEKALDLSGVVEGKHGWSRSYANLSKNYGFYFTVSNGSIKSGVHGGSRTTAGKFGARASKLLEYLGPEHYDVKLSGEDFHRITLWLDCNSEFYGAYHSTDMQARGGDCGAEVGLRRPMSDNPERVRFRAAYEGKPPWDRGHPQSPFVEAADQITGCVLDAGCGTGDNALFFARRGQPVMGMDFVEFPINQAKRKAQELGVEAEFVQMDALELTSLDRRFNSVIDCGLFHVLSDADRRGYVEGLAHVTKLGGKVFLMCFSDKEPEGPGPRRVSQDELRDAFAEGWAVESIVPAQFEPSPESKRKFADGGPKAWFAVIRRAG